MGGERKGRPEAGDYLWAGMPWAGYLLWDHSPQWLVVPGGEVPDLSGSAVDSSDLPWVCTAIDADGNPVELAFARTGEYLFKPAYWNLNTNFDVSQPRIDVPSGMLAVTVGGEVSMRPPDMIGRRPVRAGARLVTVDASVLLAGLRPTKFRPCDAIFVSGAVVAELAMYRERYPDGDTSPIRGSSWRLSVPVPVDDRVLAVYRDLAFRVDRQDGAPAISRVDLLCVATALVYGAAMYTTDPEVYAGLGVEVLRYGETRNPDAVDRKTPRAAGKRRGSDPTRSELARSRRACSLVPVTAPLGGAGEGPAPVEYLWAGLPCPDDALRGSGRPKVVVSAGEVPDMSGWPADSEVLPWVCTAVDGDGGPVEVAFARTERFLFRPAYWNLNSRFDVSDPVRHVPSGLLEVTAGEPGPPRVSDVVGVRPVRAGARLVTVDTSVLLAGLRPEKFRPDDVLLVSMAAITEFEVYLERLPGGGVRLARGEPWLLSTPTPVDSGVVSYFEEIVFGLQRARNPVVVGRVDLLCAATAVVYGAALYTTDPQAYIGAGQGLKVLKYGKTRNPAARRTDPNQAEPVDTVSGRAVPDQVLDTSAAADAGRDRVAVDAEPRPRRSRVRKKRSHQLSAPKPRPAPASRPEVGLSVPVVQVSAEGWVFGVDRAGGIVLPDRTVSGNQPATSERIRAADWHPEGTRFVRVSSGVKGLAALSSEGRVYYLNYVDGLAGNGPLVRGLLPFPEGTLMVDVAAGDDFVLAASADGRAHVLTIRRLPIGGGALKEVAEVVVADLPDGVRAVRVAAGHAHCVVLDSEGRVHAWGVNAYGQLGDGSRVDRDQPVLATAFAHSGPVVEIHASATATAVVTASGKIRQVGAVLAERRRARPVFQACPKGRAPGLPRGTTVTTMSLGEGHALALAKDGQVYAWGSNGALQLGCDPQIKVSARPRGVEGLPDGLEVTQLAAGEMYSIALATDGSACAWGWNEEGLLGIRSPDELQRRPAKMYWTPQAATPQSTPPPATPLPSTP